MNLEIQTKTLLTMSIPQNVKITSQPTKKTQSSQLRTHVPQKCEME
jgi:hypothetical protein